MQTVIVQPHTATDFFPSAHLPVAATTQARNALYRAGQDAYRNGATPQEMATAEMARGYFNALRAAADAETSMYLMAYGPCSTMGQGAR